MPCLQKKAISTSLISGLTRASNSEDSSRRGKIQKNRNAVTTDKPTITIKFLSDRFNRSMSFVAKEKPKPKIGPISGDINMAPITTAVELAFKPIEAIKIEQINIQEVCPLKGISAMIDSLVACISVLVRMLRSSLKKLRRISYSPFADCLSSGVLFILFNC
jgi:hypothetical protein